MAAQLSLFEDVDEKEVRRIVVRELKRFKSLRVAIKNKQELEEQGITCLFPSLRKNYKEQFLKYKHMKRAIEEALDGLEREIIERKYLGEGHVKDVAIYIEMGITKDQYYSCKKQAIFQIATALGII